VKFLTTFVLLSLLFILAASALGKDNSASEWAVLSLSSSIMENDSELLSRDLQMLKLPFWWFMITSASPMPLNSR
jgi:hypothetical protein